jgi:hypothetical protein
MSIERDNVAERETRIEQILRDVKLASQRAAAWRQEVDRSMQELKAAIARAENLHRR